MRRPLFLTMAYIAGPQGFALFAPYLLAFAFAAHLARLWQKRRDA